MEEQFLCPLPCATADGVKISHSISLIHIAHVTFRIHHILQFYGLPVIIAEIMICQGIVNVFQHMFIAFVPQQYCCQVAPSPYLKVAMFDCHFLRP